MLYKKVHRQYLRQFKRGRKFKDRYGEVYEVAGKPQMDRTPVCVSALVKKTRKCSKYHNFQLLITPSGRFLYKDEFKWLD